METNYIDLPLGNRVVKVRKWKVKDRNNLKKAFSENKDEVKNGFSIIKYLVEDCLDKEYALNPDEITYILSFLRSICIDNKFKLKYKCNECGNVNDLTFYILDKDGEKGVLHPKFKEESFDNLSIDTKSFHIELQEVKNIKFYKEVLMKSQNTDLDDLILHIKSINSESKSYKELKELFEDCETDEVDEIISIFNEMRFSLDKKNEVQCCDCLNTRELEFDTIPELLPIEWLKK